MTSYSRSRSKEWGNISGGTITFAKYYAPLYGYTGHTSEKACADSVNSTKPFRDNDLSMQERRSVRPLLIYGECDKAYFAGPVTYNGFNPYKWSNPFYYNIPMPITNTDWAYWVTKALAHIDPYKPVVDLPLFLFELKDMPRMLRDAGRYLSGRVGFSDVPGSVLGYRFGWAPLVSDALSMFDFALKTDQRMRYLRNLEKGSRVHRTLYNGQVYSTVTPNGTVVSHKGRISFRGDDVERQHLRVWFSANGKLVDTLPNSDSELRTLSRRIVTGLTFRPATYWDYLPWTWLIDYFFNIGEYMRAKNGFTHVKTSRLNVMAETKTSRSLTNVRLATGLTYSPPIVTNHHKYRRTYPNPVARIARVPFMNNGQRTVLGALLTAAAFKALK